MRNIDFRNTVAALVSEYQEIDNPWLLASEIAKLKVRYDREYDGSEPLGGSDATL